MQYFKKHFALCRNDFYLFMCTFIKRNKFSFNLRNFLIKIILNQRLIKWFGEMQDVKSPNGLAEFFLKKYPVEVIRRSLDVAKPTSRAGFSDACEQYSGKGKKKTPELPDLAGYAGSA